MELQFYIIITPGSLKFLKFALWSLQRRHDLSIILVSNGLNLDEINSLKLFSESIECQYLILKTDSVLSHGMALNQLIENHQGTYFCFCDSDIVSTDAMADDIPLDNKYVAWSSCDAMFWDDSPVKGLLGRCNQWPDGSPNLSSFFCIYNTEVIKESMKRYGLGFENIRINEIKSSAVKKVLINKGVVEDSKKRLDTGKALTASLDLGLYHYAHVEIPSLLHIGGMSSWMLNGDKSLLHTKYHLTDSELYDLAPLGSWLFNSNAHKSQGNKMFFIRRQQRLAAARYCFQMISHFVDKTPKPSHTLSNQDLNQKLKQISNTLNQYRSHFNEY